MSEAESEAEGALNQTFLPCSAQHKGIVWNSCLQPPVFLQRHPKQIKI